MRLKISARQSDLARLQAYMVGDALKDKHPGLEIEYRFKESLGDKNLTDPLWKIPEKGVFTEDFLSELIQGETDMVVHSWKDLPTEAKTQTEIVATLPRADQRDLLLVKRSHFEKIRSSQTLRIFSSSPRREYNLAPFLKTHLPFLLQEVRFESVRGNIPTRIRKLLESSETDALIVAKAALDRLLSAPQDEFASVRQLLRSYLQELEWVVLPLTINPNAAAQGALAVEIRNDRKDLREILQTINDPVTFRCAQKERDILAGYGGGCHQKIGTAILPRPYGEITLVQGLTDGGQVLTTRELSSLKTPPRFTKDQLWSSEFRGERIQKSDWSLPSSVNAVYVARSEAWPETLKFSKFVWSAGLKTWQSLSQKGLWVHGCSESLGEQEDARLEVLAGSPLHWAKLTHETGYSEDSSNMDLIATYTLRLSDEIPSLEGKEFFFWNSGSQFLNTVKSHPELLDRFHACGPGNTWKVISTYLKSQNRNTDRLSVYLDQEDWRKKCTK